MSLLILGLVLFLGAHSVRIVADGWRAQMIGRLGEGPWKGLYSVVSLAGLALIVYGYGLARQQPVVLWNPPFATRHAASLLTLLAFLLLAAAYVPRNAIKAKLHHPMVLGVKTWALAHLISNGNLADVLLFGGFLLWSVLDFRAARQRDRAQGTQYPAGTAAGTAGAVVAGLVAWAAFAFWAHAPLIGVSPMGR
ncbi:NnrU family protein [Simplicispira lacusdiani]|uniref:NnrU family protein n=1 Tax=Simplicispira lacusdiani TaxID=2213010 RepID=UPI000E729F01|nr:NnrU family protein [Simplicispira lacusdiani]